MMRILLDLQALQGGSRNRGIGRYVMSIAREIVREPAGHEIFILLSNLIPEAAQEIANEFSAWLPPERIIFFSGAGPTSEIGAVTDAGNIGRLRISEVLYEKLIADIDPDALLIGSLFEGADDDIVGCLTHLHRRHVTAMILYDLIPLIDPDKYIGWDVTRRWYHRRIESLRRADLLLAISQSARQEAIDHLDLDGTIVVPIGTAVSEEFIDRRDAALSRANELKKFGIKRPFLMHMSAFEERKNFDGLIRAFAAMPQPVRTRHQLVLVCKINDNDRERMLDLAQECGLQRGDVIFPGFVADADLPLFYANCALFVFPSFHEGFGLPALEAMSCGAPTIGSNVSSVPEVIGRADATFDPRSTKAIAEIMTRALTDQAYRQSLIDHAPIQAARFRWDNIAALALRSLEQAVAARSTSPAAPTRQDQLQQNDVRSIAPIIASIANEHSLPEDDWPSVAMALAANENSATRVRALATPDNRLRWRIEGPFDSSYSLALVNRETARALAKFGHEVVLHSTEGPGDIDANPAFLAQNPDIAAMHEHLALVPADKSDVTTRNLFPPRVADMAAPINGLNGYAWEETGFPAEWIDQFNEHLSFIACTSRHTEKVLLDNGAQPLLSTIGNGVDHWDRVTVDPSFRIEGRRFRFLHVSSCFPRKGVDALLAAYGRAFSMQDDVTLVIKTFDNPHNEIGAMLAEARAANPLYPNVELIVDDLSESQLKALYEQCHVLVFPSRAEGFGLPIAEAMLSGLPSIVTGWSGQLDFCNSANSWLVDYHFEKATSHLGVLQSAWATIDVEQLVLAMRDAHASTAEQRRTMTEVGRAQLQAEYRWSDVAAKLVHTRNAAAGRKITQPKIGWVTTWNSACGIATYSAHLIDHVAADVTIFAAQGQPIIAEDTQNCIRSWTIGKEDNQLSTILDACIDRDVNCLIIQFNYNFYNHTELVALIDGASDAGIAIIMVLHSTVDPVEVIPGAELHLIKTALARCDRLLVHSIPDLNRLKAIGLVDNVALLPHGVRVSPNAKERPAAAGCDKKQLIGSYGFMLPHKGLLELVEAVALMRAAGSDVRLRMVNALYPDPISRKLRETIAQRIVALDIGDAVEIYDDFLSDEQSLSLLRDCDLIVFPYQKTGESASGAIRYGIASGQPVAVTPLDIFGDVASATFRLPGTSARDIATGLKDILVSIRTDDAAADQIAKSAEAFLAQHDYKRIGRRLANIAGSLVDRQVRGNQIFLGSQGRCDVTVAVPAGRALRTTGKAGAIDFALGAMPLGRYMVSIEAISLSGGAENPPPIGVSILDLQGQATAGERYGENWSVPVRAPPRSVTVELSGSAKWRIDALVIERLPSTPETVGWPEEGA